MASVAPSSSSIENTHTHTQLHPLRGKQRLLNIGLRWGNGNIVQWGGVMFWEVGIKEAQQHLYVSVLNLMLKLADVCTLYGL